MADEPTVPDAAVEESFRTSLLSRMIGQQRHLSRLLVEMAGHLAEMALVQDEQALLVERYEGLAAASISTVAEPTVPPAVGDGHPQTGPRVPAAPDEAVAAAIEAARSVLADHEAGEWGDLQLNAGRAAAKAVTAAYPILAELWARHLTAVEADGEPPDGSYLAGLPRDDGSSSVFHRDDAEGHCDVPFGRFTEDRHWWDFAAREWITWSEAKRRGAEPRMRLIPVVAARPHADDVAPHLEPVSRAGLESLAAITNAPAATDLTVDLADEYDDADVRAALAGVRTRFPDLSDADWLRAVAFPDGPDGRHLYGCTNHLHGDGRHCESDETLGGNPKFPRRCKWCPSRCCFLPPDGAE